MNRPSPARFVLGLIFLLWSIGCGGGGKTNPAPAGPMLLAPADAAYDLREILHDSQLQGLFVEGGFASAGRLEMLPLPQLPRGVGVVFRLLVVRTSPDFLSNGAVVSEITAAIHDLENRGVDVLGLELSGLEGARVPVKALRHLHQQLPRVPLLAHVAEQEVSDEWLTDIAPLVQAITLDLYGQPGFEEDDPSRWDHRRILERARRFAEVLPIRGTFFVGGSVRPFDGQVLGRSLVDSLTLDQMVRFIHAADADFAIEGFDRQSFTGPASALSEISADSSSQLRVVRPTVAHVVVLLDRIEEEFGARWLGPLFAGVAAEGNHLGIDASHLGLVNRRQPLADPPAPVISGESALSVRVSLSLPELGVPTTLSRRKHNYVELDLGDGRFADAELGDFIRVEYLRQDTEDWTPQLVRNSNRLRLFFSFLEPGTVVTSGLVRVAATNRPRIRSRTQVIWANGTAGTSAETDWPAAQP